VLYTAHELCSALGVKYTHRGVTRTRRATEVPSPPEKPVQVSLPDEYERFTGARDEIQTKALRYLESRQVTPLQIHRHRIGFAATGTYAWRIILPVMDAEGDIYGFCSRDFSGQQKKKYINSSGLKLLWGCHQDGSTAVLCEGVMDALRVEKALMSTPRSVAVARLGSGLTSLQADQLRKYEKVIILPDFDEPGVKGSIDCAKKCADYQIQTFIYVPEVMNGKDPGSLDAEAILEAVTGAVPWNQSTEYRMRASCRKH
jgi:DNA primase